MCRKGSGRIAKRKLRINSTDGKKRFQFAKGIVFQTKLSDGITLFLPTSVSLTFMTAIKVRESRRSRRKKLNSNNFEPIVKHGGEIARCRSIFWLYINIDEWYFRQKQVFRFSIEAARERKESVEEFLLYVCQFKINLFRLKLGCKWK